MARTRKSDPGRVEALHYAATLWQRHTKPLVYAGWSLVGQGASGLGESPGTESFDSGIMPGRSRGDAMYRAATTGVLLLATALTIAAQQPTQLPTFRAAADPVHFGITFVDFDAEVRVARFNPANYERLVERIRGRKADGWTALYDAIGVYLNGAQNPAGQKVLVIYP